MKILQTCRSLGAGGIEAIVCGLSNELAKSNQVTVCTLKQNKDDDLFYNRLEPSIKKETIGKTETTSPFKVIFKVYSYIKSRDFEVVQIHGFFYYYLLAILLLHKKKRFYYTVHSDAWKENNPWDLRLLAIKRFCFRKKWVRPITISPASKESFSRLYQCESQLILNGVIPPAFSLKDMTTPYRLTSQTRLFVNPGRICPQKNQGMLCRVFDRLIKEGRDVCLIIAGPNHVESSFKEIEPFLSDRIRYIGESSDIPSLLHYADGMALSSAWEGMPVVILEALAAGCPCICTPVGGVVNMIEPGNNGFLSASVSEDDFYRAMIQFLSLSESEIAEMRDNARKSFEPYNVEIMAANYYNYYRSNA